MRDIAIVGMGCRFPGAQNLQDYWRLLLSGRRQFTSVPSDRWDHAEYFDPDDKRGAKGSYTDQIAVIDGVDQFDAAHFRMSPRRVQNMDPQHRLLLQVSREALQDAGWERRPFDRATTGVFFAMSSSEYAEYSPDVKQIQPFTVPGVLLNMAAATVSQYYDLGGPSFTVDAACSSSLIALYEAVTHLRAGHCREAIVGGAYLALAPNGLVGFAKVGALSQAGVCRPFDRRADGFVLGEGVGAVVLRPLEDAVAAGDRIYAVVRGVGCSNDGITDGPMTPRQQGQEIALRRAYADAECTMDSVGFIEAHGTATVVGDRTELEAIKAVRTADRQDSLDAGPDRGSYLSSVKSMIGHSLSAAGMASVIKAALVLHHGTVVPQPETDVDPEVGLAEAGLRIAAEPVPWPAEVSPRRVGVNGFGFGGTNVHVVIEDAPAAPTTAEHSENAQTTEMAAEGARPELFLLSAGTPALLAEHIGRLLAELDDQPEATVRELAWTLAQRDHLPARLAVVAADLAELREKLTQAQERLAEGETGALGAAGFAGKSPLPAKKRQLAFLFPGQGSQRPGMLADVFQRSAVVRDRAEALDRVLREQAGFSAVDAVHGPQAATDEGRARLTGTDVCQPALGLLGLSVARLAMDCAVRPDLALGHSVGEFPAAAIAGVLSDEDAIGLLAARGRRMRAAEAEARGGMLALRAGAERVENLVRDIDGAWPSAYNHPGQTVVSGTEAGLAETERRCAAEGIGAVRLEVSNAFHSPLLDSTREGITADLAAARLSAPQLAFVSSVSGGSCADPEQIRELWARHALAPVRFADAADAAHQAGVRIYVQLAGGHALLNTVRHNLREQEGVHYVALSGDEPDDARTFLAGLGRLAVLGIPVDLTPLFEGTPPRLLSLPPSPLRTRRYWVQAQEPHERFATQVARRAAAAAQEPATPAATAQPTGQPTPRPAAPAAAVRSTVLPQPPVKEHPVNEVVSLLREQLATLRSFGAGELSAELAAELAPAQAVAAPVVRASAPAAGRAVPAALAAPAVPVATATATAAAEAAAGRLAVRTAVVEHIARISAFPVDQLHDDHLVVQELGFDSLMLTELVGSVRTTWPQIADQLVGGVIAPRPTIREIVDAVAGLLGIDTTAVVEPAAPQAAAPAAGGVEQERRIEDFPEAKALAAQIDEPGTRNPYFLLHEGTATANTRIEGRELVCFSSYNYLGLSGHPAIRKAVNEALDTYGSSVSASRFLSGDRPVHRELEAELSSLLGTEDAIVMVSGHATNVSVIGHLLGAEDLVVHDELAHDSILQGCKLSGARRLPFPHNDMAALDELLTRARAQYRRCLIVVEGVYSMDGDLVDLPQLIEVKEKHGAIVLVDEAHSIGTIGKNGGGVGDHFGVDRSRIDLWAGTLSKSLSSCGGYVGGSADAVRYLKYSVPGFVYSVGMTPPNTAAALAAIRAMRDEPERLERLRANAELFLAESRKAGLDTGPSSDSPVVPCIVGDSAMTLQLAEALFDRGISVNPIMYPAVPESEARLRFFITSEHTDEQIRSSVATVAEELGRLRAAAAAAAATTA
ncbi:type I polyketide synthase [Streptacidiphilus anmyonensis]|uniref:type I polyketide synthase n=1 Tax=Streptacidiphilus anmyonensis TaxID=405782 RepID=UPI000A978477|nr:type I polyketide synthase [Streptacidiphilus anmyonensis]